MRAARMAVQHAASVNPHLDSGDLQAIANSVRNYLESNQPVEDEPLTPEQAAELEAQPR
jgi:hypothetical protein